MSDSPAQPLISIVIPVFNGADYLAEAIDSALAQTWPNSEIIVVDDGSDDDGQTAAIAAQYGDRIRYEYKPNGGVATAINRGIALMRGEYLSWLSHDDILAPDKLDRMMKALLAYGEPVVAFGDFAVLDQAAGSAREVLTGRDFDPRQPVWAVLEGRINGCAMLIPKECFRVCGYLRPDLPATQDYDLWFRMALKFPFVHVPGVMVHHRQHENQGSRVPRFRSEVDLLFLSMFDRLTDDVIESHAPSKMRFYERLRRSVDSPGAIAALGREIRRAAQPRSCAVLIRGTDLLSDAILLNNGLREFGISLTGVAYFHTQEERWSLLSVTHGNDGTLHFEVAPMSPESTPLTQLKSVVATIQSEYFWVAPCSQVIETPDVWTALEGLVISPEAVAYIREFSDGRLSEGPLELLEGAVLRTQALRTAFHESTGSLPSLIHALSRCGAIKTSRVAPEEILVPEPAPPVAASASAVTEEPTTRLSELAPAIPPMGWASDVLSRSSLASRVAAQAIWKFSGGGDVARNRLLEWSGLSGWFDDAWYCRRYPDVLASGLDPLRHYLMFGRYERRDPSLRFSAAAYLADHSDIAAGSLPPLQHYLTRGHRQGRWIRPAALRDAPLPDAASPGRPAILFLLSKEIDGVTAHFLDDLNIQISRRLRPLFLVGHGDGTVSLGTTPNGEDGGVFELPHGIEMIAAEARLLSVRRVMVLNRSGFFGSLPALVDSLGVPFDLVDFGLNRTPARTDATPAWPDSLQLKWLMEHASARFTPSEDSAQKWRTTSLDAPVTVAPPPDPYRLRAFRVWARPVLETEPLRVALFGSIRTDSGLGMLKAVLALVLNRSLPVRFIVFGELTETLPRSLGDLYRVFPIVRASELTVEVCRRHPHIAWFPQRAPALHCYELTDAEANGLPIAATATGAFIERLQSRPLSWLVPPESTAEDWLAFFLRVHEQGMSTEWDVPVDAPAIPDDHRQYQHHLYSAVFGNIETRNTK